MKKDEILLISYFKSFLVLSDFKQQIQTTTTKPMTDGAFESGGAGSGSGGAGGGGGGEGSGGGLLEICVGFICG